MAFRPVLAKSSALSRDTYIKAKIFRLVNLFDGGISMVCGELVGN